MMKTGKSLKPSLVAGGLALALAAGAFVPRARANVYATDVKVNGGITNVIVAQGTGVSIGYILNEPASMGVTVDILSGTNVVRAISVAAGGPGALLGTNTVVWDGKDYQSNNPPGGVYSVSVTAASSGFTNWTQTTVDTNEGNYVWAGTGIAVDQNQSSPYYGRVLVGNAYVGPSPGTMPGDGVGILKLNADASPADESPTNWLTTGGYPWAGDGFSPWKIEVSADDYVYIEDFTSKGVVGRWDPTLSTNSLELVLSTNNWGDSGGVSLSGPAIFGAGTNTEIWMVDDRFPGFPVSLGLIRYKVTTNGACATNDTGTPIVGLGTGTNSLDEAPNDVALDANHNIYAIQDITDTGNPSSRVFRFPAYDPATNGGVPEVNATWAVGSGDDTYAGAYGIAVDPTGSFVAVAFWGVLDGTDYTNGNTRVFSATNGALIAELDANPGLNIVDTDCAWDAVGNAYFVRSFLDGVTPGQWRAVSPPGTNRATTLAVATVQVTGPSGPVPHITGIAESGGTVTITFTAGVGTSPASLRILGAAQVGGPYSIIPGATIRVLDPGLFQAVFPASGAQQYYRIERLVGMPPLITNITVSAGLVGITFTAAATDYPWFFTLQSANQVAGAYTDVATTATQLSPGVFGFSTAANGPTRFYRVRR